MTPLGTRSVPGGRNAARQTKACDNCRLRKRKCDGILPCRPCQSRKVKCIYRTQPEGRRHSTLTKELPPSKRDSLDARQAAASVSSSENVPAVSTKAPRRNSSHHQSQQPKRRNPGGLVFGLNIGDNGELEYRGPTSSTTGLSVSTNTNPSYPLPGPTIAKFPLPSREMLEYHMELFLEWQNSSIIIVAGFQADGLFNSSADASPSPGTQLLLLSIISLTSRFSRDSSEVSSDAYFHSAKEMLLQAAFSKPSIEVVQAASILACREYGCGHENAAWTLSGIAATVGSTLGLHVLGDAKRWVASGHITENEVQIRSVAYWATVVIDRILASCLGRHCLIHPTDFTTPPIRIRLPAEQSSLAPSSEVLTFGSPDYENNVLDTFRHSVDFWKFNDRSLSDVYDFRHDMSNLGLDSPERSDLFTSLEKLVTKYRTELFAWYESLPASIEVSPMNRTPHALLFEMAYNNLVILMHRPFIDVGDDGSADNSPCQESPETILARQSRMHSTTSAIANTEHIKTLQAHYRFSCIPFPVSHYILTTATIHVVDAESSDLEVAANAAEGLKTCLLALEEISQCWPIAGRAILMIRNLEDEMQAQGRRGLADNKSNRETSRSGSPVALQPDALTNEGVIPDGTGHMMPFNGGETEATANANVEAISWESIMVPDADDPIAKLLSDMPLLNYSEELFWGSLCDN